MEATVRVGKRVGVELHGKRAVLPRLGKRSHSECRLSVGGGGEKEKTTWTPSDVPVARGRGPPKGGGLLLIVEEEMWRWEDQGREIVPF